MRSRLTSHTARPVRFFAVAASLVATCMALPACSDGSDDGSTPTGTESSSDDGLLGDNEPPVPDACPLLTDEEVTAVYTATGPGAEDRDNEALTYCIWPSGTTSDSMLLEIKGLTAATLEQFQDLDQERVNAGNKELIAGLGDFATYDPGLDSVTVYIGQVSVTILANPVLDKDALATLATTAVSRLN